MRQPYPFQYLSAPAVPATQDFPAQPAQLRESASADAQLPAGTMIKQQHFISSSASSSPPPGSWLQPEPPNPSRTTLPAPINAAMDVALPAGVTARKTYDSSSRSRLITRITTPARFHRISASTPVTLPIDLTLPAPITLPVDLTIPATVPATQPLAVGTLGELLESNLSGSRAQV